MRRRVLLSVVLSLPLIGGCYGGVDPMTPEQGDGSSGGLSGSVPGTSTGETPESTSTSGSSVGTSTTEGTVTSTTSTSGITEATGDDTSTGAGSAESSSGSDAESSSGGLLEGCAAQTDAVVCEDFEDDLDETLWSFESQNTGTVALEDGMLHVQLGLANGAHGGIETQPGQVFPLENNHLFGRVRMLTEPVVPNGHNYILGAWGTLDGAVARYRLDSNNTTLNSRYTHTPTVEQHGGLRKMGRGAVPGVWTCIEWEYDGSTNSMRYWFDGELDVDMEVDGATENPSWVAPTFDRFELGYHTYQPSDDGTQVFDFWFDDLVLADARVGC